MRTTVDIPDDLFREAKAKAALEGVKLKDVVNRGLIREVRGSVEEIPRRTRLQYPFFPSLMGEKLDIPNDAAFQAEQFADRPR